MLYYNKKSPVELKRCETSSSYKVLYLMKFVKPQKERHFFNFWIWLRYMKTKDFLNPQRESNQWPSRILVGRSNYWSYGRLVVARSYTDRREAFSSLAVWQDTCHTYENLVYDLAHHQSPITQWLERPTGILEGHGLDFRWALRKLLSITTWERFFVIV